MLHVAEHALFVDSPVGLLLLRASTRALTGLDLARDRVAALASTASPVLRAAERQLEEYFRGERTTFDLPLEPQGTEFQRRVWRALLQIPYGATWSYQRLARAIGQPTATRAVGASNGKNPIAIVIPCHRVIGADGSLTGYAGGLDTKRWLLAHEAARAQPALPFTGRVGAPV